MIKPVVKLGNQRLGNWAQTGGCGLLSVFMTLEDRVGITGSQSLEVQNCVPLHPMALWLLDKIWRVFWLGLLHCIQNKKLCCRKEAARCFMSV